MSELGVRAASAEAKKTWLINVDVENLQQMYLFKHLSKQKIN